MLCTLLAVSGIEKTSDAFRAELCRVAARLGTNPDFISAVMSVESGFNPAIPNPSSGATGLIQFMPSTAKRLGTTTADLARMTDVEQLVYVEAYLRPFAGRMNNEQDVYLAVFCPGGVGKSSDFVLATQSDDSQSVCGASSAKVYEQNHGLDVNHDGVITTGDVGSVVRSILAKAQTKPPIVLDVDFSGAPAKRAFPIGPVVAFASAAGLGFLLVREASSLFGRSHRSLKFMATPNLWTRHRR